MDKMLRKQAMDIIGQKMIEIGYGYYWLEDDRNNLLINKDGKILNTKYFYFLLDTASYKTVIIGNKRTNTRVNHDTVSKQEYIDTIFNNTIYYSNILILIQNSNGTVIIETTNSKLYTVNKVKLTDNKISSFSTREGDGVLYLELHAANSKKYNVQILDDGCMIY